MLQGLVSNEGDGWDWTLEELDRYYEASARRVLFELYDGLPSRRAEPVELSQAEKRLSRGNTLALISMRRPCWASAQQSYIWRWPTPRRNRRSAPEPLSVEGYRRIARGTHPARGQRLRCPQGQCGQAAGHGLRTRGLVISRRTVVLDRLRQLATQANRCAAHPHPWGLSSGTGAAIQRRLRHSGL